MNNYEKNVLIDMDKNMWLQRNSHYYSEIAWKVLGFNEDGSFDIKNGCYISIGCGSGKLEKSSFEKILEKDDTEKWNAFEKIYSEIYSKKSTNRYSLYRFLFEFKIGDYIVIPGNKTFNVFQIESEVLDYSNIDIIKSIKNAGGDIDKIINNKEDFKYFRKLKPVRLNIPRKGYAEASLRSKLNYRGTMLKLSDDAKVDLINAVKSDKPISLYSSAMDALTSTFLEEIKKIDPNQFERLIQWYFKKINADESIILPKNYSSKIGKEDADIRAKFEDLKIVIYIQAKLYNEESDLKNAIEQIKEYKIKNPFNFEDKDFTKLYWIISTTKNPEKIEVDEDIRIIEGIEFAEMLLKVGLQNIDEPL